MRLAVIGGSGVDLATVLGRMEPRTVDTPYGEALVEVGRSGDREVGFLRRHGRGHAVPPHRINYRANLWALADLGVERVLATAAVGSLRRDLGPGTFVLVDQFMDFTRGRPSTFHDGGEGGVVHVDVTEPYCPELRRLLAGRGRELDLPVREGGVYVCTEGPRYETPAEIRAFAMLGGDVVGMTGVPEVVLARELGLCYASISMVTNLAAGIAATPLSHQEVLEAQAAAADGLARLLRSVLGDVPAQRSCPCPRRADAG